MDGGGDEKGRYAAGDNRVAEDVGYMI